MEAAHGIAQEMGEPIMGSGLEPVAQDQLHDGRLAGTPAHWPPPPTSRQRRFARDRHLGTSSPLD